MPKTPPSSWLAIKYRQNGQIRGQIVHLAQFAGRYAATAFVDNDIVQAAGNLFESIRAVIADVKAFLSGVDFDLSSWNQICQAQADAFGIGIDDYKQLCHDHWSTIKNDHDRREHAKRYARKLTGLNAGDLRRMDNNGQDYSSIRFFDEIADSINSEYPGLFSEFDNLDSQLWDLIISGVETLPTRTSREYHAPIERYLINVGI